MNCFSNCVYIYIYIYFLEMFDNHGCCRLVVCSAANIMILAARALLRCPAPPAPGPRDVPRGRLFHKKCFIQGDPSV